MLFVAPFFDVQYRKTLKTSENVRNVNLLRTHDASPWLDFFLLKKIKPKGAWIAKLFFRKQNSRFDFQIVSKQAVNRPHLKYKVSPRVRTLVHHGF
jgi:hypothetical protein